MQLKDLQRDFINAIFQKNNASVAKRINGDDKLTAEQRLGIYRGSVHGILTTSLGVTFPVTKALVGEVFFDHMCDHFIDQSPPKSPFFSKYGSNFSVFIEQFEATESISYLSDVANLEWSRHTLGYETLTEPVDLTGIADITEEQQSTVCFKLKQSLRLIESKYRIDLIWFAHQVDNNMEPKDLKALEYINIDEAVKLLIWKGEDGIKLAELEETHAGENNDKQYWDFLQAIANKNNITQLAEHFGELLPSYLNRCIKEGWITSFTLN